MKKKTPTVKVVRLKAPPLKSKKIKGVITTLKVLPYKGCMVYLRRIGLEMFEYLLIFNNQIYSAYWVIKIDKGKKDLTKNQFNSAGALVMAGACTTIDTLLDESISKADKERVRVFEQGRDMLN